MTTVGGRPVAGVRTVGPGAVAGLRGDVEDVAPADVAAAIVAGAIVAGAPEPLRRA